MQTRRNGGTEINGGCTSGRTQLLSRTTWRAPRFARLGLRETQSTSARGFQKALVLCVSRNPWRRPQAGAARSPPFTPFLRCSVLFEPFLRNLRYSSASSVASDISPADRRLYLPYSNTFRPTTSCAGCEPASDRP